MEKVIAALWGVENEALLARLPVALQDAGASKVRINIRDAAVDAGAGLIQTWQDPQQQAVVQYWLPSANALFRAKADTAIGCRKSASTTGTL